MKKIFKYELESTHNRVQLPIGTNVLSVGCQQESIFIWCLIDTNKDGEALLKSEMRHFHVFGTGWEVPDAIDASVFIGTVQMPSKLVLHVFMEKA